MESYWWARFRYVIKIMILDHPDLLIWINQIEYLRSELSYYSCKHRVYIYQEKAIEEPPFEISHQSLDPESSKSVNLDKPDQDNLDSRNLPLVNWPQLGRFLSDFKTFWFKWSPNESHISRMILIGVTQPPIAQRVCRRGWADKMAITQSHGLQSKFWDHFLLFNF